MNVLNRLFNNLTLSRLVKLDSCLFFYQKNQNIFTLVNYLVIRRISSEPKFRRIYRKFVSIWEKKFRDFYNFVLKKSVEVVLLFLKKRINDIANPEWKILKTLGKWIGRLTLARGRPLLFRFMSIPHFLLRAYDQGTLIYSLPFFSSLLNSSLKSKVYKTKMPLVEEVTELFFEISKLIFIKATVNLDLKLFLKKFFGFASCATMVFFFFEFEKEDSVYFLNQKMKRMIIQKNILIRNFLEDDLFLDSFKIKIQRKSIKKNRLKKLSFKGRFLTFDEVKMGVIRYKGEKFFLFLNNPISFKILNQKNFNFEPCLGKKLKTMQRTLNSVNKIFIKGINEIRKNKTIQFFDFLSDYHRVTLMESFYYYYFSDEKFSQKLFFIRLLEMYFLNFWTSIFNNFSSSSFIGSSLYYFKLKFKFHSAIKKKGELISRHFYILPTIFRGLKRKHLIEFSKNSKISFSKFQTETFLFCFLCNREESFIKKIFRKTFRLFFLY